MSQGEASLLGSSFHHRLTHTSPLVTEFDWPELKGLNVLDLACGSGRNGLWFLARGANVTFIDQDLSTLATLTHPNARLLAWNLEDASAPELSRESFDIVLVFNYLHRPLFPQIQACLKPQGVIVYETFTRQQAQMGRPKNPDFLLMENELNALFANWKPLHYFEGQLSDPISMSQSFKAQLIAQK